MSLSNAAHYFLGVLCGGIGCTAFDEGKETGRINVTKRRSESSMKGQQGGYKGVNTSAKITNTTRLKNHASRYASLPEH
jgi:hypothetical protein